MTLLLSTDGTLSVICLIKETEDTVFSHTVAVDIAVPSAVAVADLPSSLSILPVSLISFNCRSVKFHDLYS